MRKHGTYPCVEPGCHKVCVTPQALGSHKHIVHKIVSTNPKTIAFMKTYRYQNRLALKRVDGQTDQPVKRTYTKRVAVPPATGVSFCPRCGTNIGAIILAMQLSGK